MFKNVNCSFDLFFLFFSYLREINSSVNSSSLLEFMDIDDCSDFSNQSTILYELLNKYKKSEKTLNQINNELCQPYIYTNKTA